MAGSSESGVDPLDHLKQQLQATFGCSENGSLNIAELQCLLRSLIELHVKYNIGRKENSGTAELSSSNTKGKSASPIPVASVGTNQPANDTLPPDRTIEGEGGSMRPDTPSKEYAEFLVEGKGLQYAMEAITEDEQRMCGRISQQIEEENGTLPSDESRRTSLACSFEFTAQRSSDFDVKSTSSKSTGPLVYSHCEIENPPGTAVEKRSCDSCENMVPVNISSNTQETETPSSSVDCPFSLSDVVAMLAGCKNHLEAVEGEVAALKNRCQSQLEDMITLATGMDKVVERLDSQEPKVSKLEQDIHCLGMLVSDYEQNFERVEKQHERTDSRTREFERVLQRIDNEEGRIKAELRTIGEQVDYLSGVKADKMDVRTELSRRALITDLQLRVPYDVFEDGVRELTRFVTQIREVQHEVAENLKTVQYELVKGLGTKAAVQDVLQLRKQLVSVLARWQKAERAMQASVGDASAQLIMGNFRSAAVAIAGAETTHSTGRSTCLSCGVQTTLDGYRNAVPPAVRFVSSWQSKSHARNAGGLHTTCVPAERIFRTESLGMAPKVSTKHKGTK